MSDKDGFVLVAIKVIALEASLDNAVLKVGFENGVEVESAKFRL